MKNLILKTELVEWDKLTPFQPDDLKKTNVVRMEKLQRSLHKNGFAMSFYVWETPQCLYVLDGHYRIRALQGMLDSGVPVPTKLPCVFLDIENKKHAKKIVLAFNSHYAEMNKEGILDFASDLNLDEVLNEFEFFDLGLDFIKKEPEDTDEEIDLSEFRDEMELKFQFTKEEYEKVVEVLGSVHENKEQALLSLL